MSNQRFTFCATDFGRTPDELGGVLRSLVRKGLLEILIGPNGEVRWRITKKA
jgi:hypothetical protein